MRVNVPSDLKFEVYHAVDTLQMSRREAARKFGLSLTRIQQIVADVSAFIRDHGSKNLLGVAPERVELVSLRRCNERLSFFYHALTRRFMVADATNADAVTVIRLMQACARLAIEQGKLEGRIGKVEQAMRDAGTLAEHDYEYVKQEYECDEIREPQEAAAAASLPPAGGCTVNADATTARDQQVVRPASASSDFDTTSDELFQAILTRKIESPPEKTPAQLRPLSRKERRRRNR